MASTAAPACKCESIEMMVPEARRDASASQDPQQGVLLCVIGSRWSVCVCVVCNRQHMQAGVSPLTTAWCFLAPPAPDDVDYDDQAENPPSDRPATPLLTV